MFLDLPPSAFDDVLTPALVIRLEAVRENLKRLRTAAGGVDRLRLHVKSAKLALVFRELIDAGVRNFKCATTREAAFLLAELDHADVAGDLLVAYPHVGANLRRVEELAARHPNARVSIVCESLPIVSTGLGVFVDVNAGMNRTGIPLEQTERILEVARAAGQRFRGVHFYEGHVHSGSFSERCAQAHPLYDRLLELVHALDGAGASVGEVITSGTPSLMPALAHAGLRGLDRHRVSPGTLVYSDARSAECEELDYEFAAFVLARVVSHPADRIVTVDAGSKSIAAEAGAPVAVAPDWPNLVARTPSEEHLPFDVVDGDAPKRCTILALVPRHVCPTVNLAEEALLIDGSDLRVVPVSARAHELRP